MVRLRTLAVLALLFAPAAWGRDGDPVLDAVLKKYGKLGGILATLSGEDRGKPEHRERLETIKRYSQNEAAIAAFDPAKPETVQPAVDALKALYFLPGQKDGNFKNIHWILQKTDVISAEQSARIAAIRNEMTRQICHEMTVVHGEIHKVDFSPAKDAQSDIDHTFRPAPGSSVTGEQLRDEFNSRFEKKFQIPAGHMDVVSHPFEARIPDWKQQATVDDFVLELRRGSALLMDNPEAYFLEGAFRQQVDRRGFEGKDKKGNLLELYVVYHHNPKLGEGAKVGELIQYERCTVDERKFKVSERVYNHVRPEVRESYAMGVSVGNWYFYHHHVLKDPDQAVRFAAKYGLRSFGEGPGYVVLKGSPGADESLPKTYEELVGLPAEREAVVEEVYRRHYEPRPEGPEGPARPGVGLTLQEVKDTLGQALKVRNAADYNAERERIFGPSALLLAGGSPEVYNAKRSQFLKQAEQQFEQRISKIMIQNIESSLPLRMKDWLKPEVNPARLGIDPRHLADDAPPALKGEAQAKIDDARKRLRTSALLELVVAVNRLDPDVRVDVFSRITAQHKADESFCRALATLQKVASKPPGALTLLQTDEQAKRDPQRKKNKDVRMGAGKDAVTLKTEGGLQELGRQIAESETVLKKDLDAVRAELTAADVEIPEARTTAASRLFSQTVDVTRGSEAHRIARATLHDWKLQSLSRQDRETWSHLTALDLRAAPNVQTLKREFIDDALSWGSVDSMINIIRAYRAKEGGDLQGALVTALTEAANMLPLVSQGVQVVMLAHGDVSALLGLGVAGVGFLCPGVGQVYMAYSIASNAWQLAAEIAHDALVQLFWQGDIPGKDGQVQPRKPGEPPPFLADVYAALKEFREKRRREIRSIPIPDRREPLREELERLWPENMTGVENYVFAFYDPELDAKIDVSKTPEQRDAIKFADLDAFQVGDDNDFGNLPVMLRAYFGRQVALYMKGEGPYASIKGAMSDLSIQDQILFNGPRWRGKPRSSEVLQQDLVYALTVGYRDALRARMDGRAPEVRIPLPAGADSCIKGRAGRTIPLSPGAPVNVPDLPSILLPVEGATFEEKQRNFFAHHDRELEKLLEQKGVPREDRDRVKAGLTDAEAAPADVEPDPLRRRESPVLTFFKRKVKAYREKHGVTRLVMTDAMEATLAEQLMRTYKLGLVRRITERHNEQKRMEELILLQLAARQAAIPAALAGDPAERRESLKQLAMHSGDPVFFDEKEERKTIVDELVDKETAGAEVKILVPEGMLLPGKPLKLACEVRASRHYRRPFQFEWSYSVPGKDLKKPSADVKTTLQLRSMELGKEIDESVSVTVSVSVKDALGVPVGDHKIELGRKSPGTLTAVSKLRSDSIGVELIFRDWYLEPMFASANLQRYKRDFFTGVKKIQKEYCTALVRLQYDNRVVTRHIGLPLAPTPAEMKEFKSLVLVKIDRPGVFPCKIEVYAGPPGTPSWITQVPLSCKEGDYAFVASAKAKMDYCQGEYDKLLREYQNKPKPWHPPVLWQWTATKHDSALNAYGWLYYLQNRAGMEQAEDEWIRQSNENFVLLAWRPGGSDDRSMPLVNKGPWLLRNRINRLLASRQEAAAERLIARMEACLTLPDGRKTDEEVTSGGMLNVFALGLPITLRDSYSALYYHYKDEMQDRVGAARVVERMAKSGLYNEKSLEYYRNALKEPDRGYYPPEAYRK